GLHLLRRALLVGPRLRTVHHAAAGELRCPDGPLPGAPGALLPVWLPAAAAHLAARLGGVRTLPGRGLLGNDHLVDQRNVDLGLEDLGGQLRSRSGVTGRGLRLSRGPRLSRAHFASLFTGDLTALRTSTRPPAGPGTAPLMSSSPRPASTPCRVRLA